jgi:HlyD family secretion protein
VKDGSVVEKGEKLVELDQAQLEEQINTQKITFEKARSAVTQAEKDFAVAEIGIKEYLEGTFKKEMQDAAAQITIAKENQRSAQNSLEYTQRMFRKGYVSSLDLESAEFGVQRAQLELDSANTAKDVLEKFTSAKMVEDLNSKLETARAKMASEKAAFALEEGKLKRLQNQIDNCVIFAPQSGMVVYANDMSRGMRGGQQAPQVEEGATVRERQNILRLPDLSKMQAKVAVHESKVKDIKIGAPAIVRIQDKRFKGNVVSVANQPEPGNWGNNTVKEYATIVRIEGEQQDLRPGMTAEVEILVDDLPDRIVLPIASIVDEGTKKVCWVQTPAKTLEKRELVLGRTDEKFVEVTDGVAEGEIIVLNPRTVIDIANKPESPVGGDDKEKGEFGEAKAPVLKSAAKGAGGPSPGGAAPAAGGAGANQAGTATPEGTAGSSAAAGGPPAGGGGAGGGGPGGGGGRFNLMSLDKDGDSKISKEEASQIPEEGFTRMDANSDGFIDQEEIQAMRSRRGGAGGGGGGGGFNLMSNDKDGDGKLSREEMPSFMPAEAFDGMDTNTDGLVDKAELDEAMKKFREMQQNGGGGAPPQ